VIELELKQHDFQRDPIGAVVEIVPRLEGQDIGSLQMWLEWEWHDSDDTTLFESSAQTGVTTLKRYTGAPNATGLVVTEGEVGAVVHARWSAAEHLDISFSLPCVESELVFLQVL